MQGAVETSGGDIVVLAWHDSRRYDLTRLSPAGQEQWQRTYGNDTLRRAEAIAPAGDGTVVLGTRSVPESTEEWVAVTRVDGGGAVTWKREYARGNLSAGAITELSGGEFAFGYARIERETGPRRSYVVRLGPTGAVQWRCRFGLLEGDTRVRALAAGPDGTVIAAGSSCTEFNPRVLCGDLLVVTYAAE